MRFVVRPGLRRILKEQGGDWAPLWVRRLGDKWYQLERTPGCEPKNAVAWIEVDRLPENVRPLVVRVLELLDEQAWMAQVASTAASD